mgnify:FL=1
MRKRRNVVFGALILAVLAALVLSLSACAKKQTATASLEPYTTGWDGAVYTITQIDAYKGTISDGTNTYSYRYDTSGTGFQGLFRTLHRHDALEDKGLAGHGGDLLQLVHGFTAGGGIQSL